VKRDLVLPAILALGSNLGDREATIRAAIDDIAATPGIRLLAVSSLIETAALKPEGVDESAPAYLNAAASVSTSLTPSDLLAALNAIEATHGRVRAERWGDRTIDIDIVAIDGLELSTDVLTVPHPRAHERSFVLAPWLELDPNAELPGRGRVDELLAGLA
jgi:2-amino-4-hydroxy-6-hydroxymethyldihydropteridine diphosphokinase